MGSVSVLWTCLIASFLLVFCSTAVKAQIDPLDVPKLPNEFQVHILGTLSSKASTFHAMEYFNGNENEGSIIIDMRSDNGKPMQMQLIYNFNKKVVKQVIDGVCTTDNITQSNIFSFGNVSFPTSGGLVGYFEKLTKVSNSVEMDNINCSQYSGDITDEGSFEKGHVDLYWSNPGAASFPSCPYNTSADCKNWTVPIRLIVTNTTGSKKEFRNEYKFYDFQTVVDDFTSFEVPPGTICIDPVPDKNSPKLPDEFSTGFEIIFSDRTSSQGKLTVRSSKSEDPKNFDHLIRIDEDLNNGIISYRSEVYDYNSGVRYTMDRNSGGCNVSNISSDGFLDKDTDKQTAMRKLINFYLETKEVLFSYAGKRFVRNLLCEVWTGIHDGMNVEVYFETLPAKSPVSPIVTDVRVPILINTSMSAGNTVIPVAEKYFYDFDVIPPRWSKFDVTTCSPNFLYKVIFQLEMKGSFGNIIKNDIEDFKTDVRNTISRVADISPIRIQKAEIDHVEDHTVLFTAMLVEDIYNSGHFGSPDKIPKPNIEVYKLLDAKIAKNDFAINYTTDSETLVFPVVGIRDDVILDALNSEEGYFRKDFSPHDNALIVGASAELVYTKLSIFECARRCIHNVAFRCDSYSYCVGSGQCVLARDHVEYIINKDVSNDGRCTTYSRNFTNDFDNEIGLTIKDSGPQTTMVNIKIEDCARICADKSNLSFFCEGFDYCMYDNTSVSSSCLFHSIHRIEVDPENLQSNGDCIQYSRNYIDDFRVMKNRTINAKAFEEISDGDATKCARDCALAAERCVAFEMCTDKEGTPRSMCMLLEDGRDKDNFPLTDSKECDHYQRVRFLNAPSQKRQVSDDEGYSGGAMAGIGIGMTIVGLIVGGGTAVYILRTKVVRP